MKEEEDNILVVSSDSEEDETSVWKKKYKNKQFQILWEKSQPLLFHHVLPEYKSTYFPYQQFKELSEHLRKSLTLVNVESTKAFIWRNIIRWLISLKLCYEGISDLKYDAKYNLILTDFMAQYLNYKCQLYSDIINETEICRHVNEILCTLAIVFSDNMPSILMTLLKIEVRDEYRLILDPIFKKYLSNKELHESNELISYLRLILCYRQWKKLAHFKNEKEAINEIAVGKSERALKSESLVDLTNKDAVLPKRVPPVTEKNRSFAVICGLIRNAIQNKAYGTRILLIKKALDLDETIIKYFEKYEEHISRTDLTLSKMTKPVKLLNDFWDGIGSSSSTSESLSEDAVLTSAEEYENQLDDPELKIKNNKKQGTNAVRQHLSRDCDISLLSKSLNNSKLNSNREPPLSRRFKQKTQTSFGKIYLSPVSNKESCVVELDSTDDDEDDKNDQKNTVSCAKQTNKTQNSAQSFKNSYIEDLRERAEILGRNSSLSRSPIILSSSSDEDEEDPSIVPARRTDEHEHSGRILNLRKENVVVLGEVSSTTTQGAESSAAQNVGTEVGILSAVQTSPNADYSALSDDDAGHNSLTGGRRVLRLRSNKWSKVVEEATSTSSTSDVPMRGTVSTPSDNVIFSIYPHRSRSSTSSSPCPPLPCSQTDSSTNTFSSSIISMEGTSDADDRPRSLTTIPQGYVRRAEENHKSAPALLSCSNLYSSNADYEVATCSRYVANAAPRVITNNKELEIGRSATSAKVDNVKSMLEEGASAAAPNISSNVNTSENQEKSLTIENDNNSEINKFLNDISAHIGEKNYSMNPRINTYQTSANNDIVSKSKEYTKTEDKILDKPLLIGLKVTASSKLTESLVDLPELQPTVSVRGTYEESECLKSSKEKIESKTTKNHFPNEQQLNVLRVLPSECGVDLQELQPSVSVTDTCNASGSLVIVNAEITSKPLCITMMDVFREEQEFTAVEAPVHCATPTAVPTDLQELQPSVPATVICESKNEKVIAKSLQDNNNSFRREKEQKAGESLLVDVKPCKSVKDLPKLQSSVYVTDAYKSSGCGNSGTDKIISPASPSESVVELQTLFSVNDQCKSFGAIESKKDKIISKGLRDNMNDILRNEQESNIIQSDVYDVTLRESAVDLLTSKMTLTSTSSYVESKDKVNVLEYQDLKLLNELKTLFQDKDPVKENDLSKQSELDDSTVRMTSKKTAFETIRKENDVQKYLLEQLPSEKEEELPAMRDKELLNKEAGGSGLLRNDAESVIEAFEVDLSSSSLIDDDDDIESPDFEPICPKESNDIDEYILTEHVSKSQKTNENTIIDGRILEITKPVVSSESEIEHLKETEYQKQIPENYLSNEVGTDLKKQQELVRDTANNTIAAIMSEDRKKSPVSHNSAIIDTEQSLEKEVSSGVSDLRVLQLKVSSGSSDTGVDRISEGNLSLYNFQNQSITEERSIIVENNNKCDILEKQDNTSKDDLKTTCSEVRSFVEKCDLVMEHLSNVLDDQQACCEDRNTSISSVSVFENADVFHSSRSTINLENEGNYSGDRMVVNQNLDVDKASTHEICSEDDNKKQVRVNDQYPYYQMPQEISSEEQKNGDTKLILPSAKALKTIPQDKKIGKTEKTLEHEHLELIRNSKLKVRIAISAKLKEILERNSIAEKKRTSESSLANKSVFLTEIQKSDSHEIVDKLCLGRSGVDAEPSIIEQVAEEESKKNKTESVLVVSEVKETAKQLDIKQVFKKVSIKNDMEQILSSKGLEKITTVIGINEKSSKMGMEESVKPVIVESELAVTAMPSKIKQVYEEMFIKNDIEAVIEINERSTKMPVEKILEASADKEAAKPSSAKYLHKEGSIKPDVKQKPLPDTPKKQTDVLVNTEKSTEMGAETSVVPSFEVFKVEGAAKPLCIEDLSSGVSIKHVMEQELSSECLKKQTANGKPTEMLTEIIIAPALEEIEVEKAKLLSIKNPHEELSVVEQNLLHEGLKKQTDTSGIEENATGAVTVVPELEVADARKTVVNRVEQESLIEGLKKTAEVIVVKENSTEHTEGELSPNTLKSTEPAIAVKEIMPIKHALGGCAGCKSDNPALINFAISLDGEEYLKHKSEPLNYVASSVLELTCGLSKNEKVLLFENKTKVDSHKEKNAIQVGAEIFDKRLHKSTKDVVPEIISDPIEEIASKKSTNMQNSSDFMRIDEHQIELRLKRTEESEENPNLSIQVHVTSEDLRDPTTICLDSETRENSPAYHEHSSDALLYSQIQSTGAANESSYLTEDQEVSNITSQADENFTYITYQNDVGTPVMDENKADIIESPSVQHNIVSLSKLKEFPTISIKSTSNTPNECNFSCPEPAIQIPACKVTTQLEYLGTPFKKRKLSQCTDNKDEFEPLTSCNVHLNKDPLLSTSDQNVLYQQSWFKKLGFSKLNNKDQQNSGSSSQADQLSEEKSEDSFSLPKQDNIETMYNSEVIKAATILADMFKKSNKVDECKKLDEHHLNIIDSQKNKINKSVTPKKIAIKKLNKVFQCKKIDNSFDNPATSRKNKKTNKVDECRKLDERPKVADNEKTKIEKSVTAPAAKRTYLQCTRLTRSTSQLIDKLTDAPTICQQKITQEILRSATETIQVKSVFVNDSNCSTDSDDTGKLVIDFDKCANIQKNKAKSLKNCKAKGTDKKLSIDKKVTEVLQKANNKAKTKCTPTLKHVSDKTLSSNSIFKLTPEVDVFLAETPKTETSKNAKLCEAITISPTERNSFYDEDSRFYPIIQLTEDLPYTPKTRLNRGRRQGSSRTKGRAVNRRILSLETTKPKFNVEIFDSPSTRTDTEPVALAKNKPLPRVKRLSFGIDTILGNELGSPPSVRDDLCSEIKKVETKVTTSEIELIDCTSPLMSTNKEMWMTNFSLRKTPKTIDAVIKKLPVSKPEDYIDHTTETKLQTNSAFENVSKKSETSEVDVLKIKEELRQLQPIRNRRKSLRTAVKILNAESNENSEDNEQIQCFQQVHKSDSETVKSSFRREHISSYEGKGVKAHVEIESKNAKGSKRDGAELLTEESSKVVCKQKGFFENKKAVKILDELQHKEVTDFQLEPTETNLKETSKLKKRKSIDHVVINKTVEVTQKRSNKSVDLKQQLKESKVDRKLKKSIEDPLKDIDDVTNNASECKTQSKKIDHNELAKPSETTSEKCKENISKRKAQKRRSVDSQYEANEIETPMNNVEHIPKRPKERMKSKITTEISHSTSCKTNENKKKTRSETKNKRKAVEAKQNSSIATKKQESLKITDVKTDLVPEKSILTPLTTAKSAKANRKQSEASTEEIEQCLKISSLCKAESQNGTLDTLLDTNVQVANTNEKLKRKQSDDCAEVNQQIIKTVSLCEAESPNASVEYLVDKVDSNAEVEAKNVSDIKQILAAASSIATKGEILNGKQSDTNGEKNQELLKTTSLCTAESQNAAVETPNNTNVNNESITWKGNQPLKKAGLQNTAAKHPMDKIDTNTDVKIETDNVPEKSAKQSDASAEENPQIFKTASLCKAESTKTTVVALEGTSTDVKIDTVSKKIVLPTKQNQLDVNVEDRQQLFKTQNSDTKDINTNTANVPELWKLPETATKFAKSKRKQSDASAEENQQLLKPASLFKAESQNPIVETLLDTNTEVNTETSKTPEKSKLPAALLTAVACTKTKQKHSDASAEENQKLLKSASLFKAESQNATVVIPLLDTNIEVNTENVKAPEKSKLPPAPSTATTCTNTEQKQSDTCAEENQKLLKSASLFKAESQNPTVETLLDNNTDVNTETVKAPEKSKLSAAPSTATKCTKSKQKQTDCSVEEKQQISYTASLLCKAESKNVEVKTLLDTNTDVTTETVKAPKKSKLPAEPSTAIRCTKSKRKQTDCSVEEKQQISYTASLLGKAESKNVEVKTLLDTNTDVTTETVKAPEKYKLPAEPSTAIRCTKSKRKQTDCSVEEKQPISYTASLLGKAESKNVKVKTLLDTNTDVNTETVKAPEKSKLSAAPSTATRCTKSKRKQTDCSVEENRQLFKTASLLCNAESQNVAYESMLDTNTDVTTTTVKNGVDPLDTNQLETPSQNNLIEANILIVEENHSNDIQNKEQIPTKNPDKTKNKAKPQLVMRVRRVSIDETNLKMTIAKSPTEDNKNDVSKIYTYATMAAVSHSQPIENLNKNENSKKAPLTLKALPHKIITDSQPVPKEDKSNETQLTEPRTHKLIRQKKKSIEHLNVMKENIEVFDDLQSVAPPNTFSLEGGVKVSEKEIPQNEDSKKEVPVSLSTGNSILNQIKVYETCLDVAAVDKDETKVLLPLEIFLPSSSKKESHVDSIPGEKKAVLTESGYEELQSVETEFISKKETKGILNDSVSTNVEAILETIQSTDVISSLNHSQDSNEKECNSIVKENCTETINSFVKSNVYRRPKPKSRTKFPKTTRKAFVLLKKLKIESICKELLENINVPEATKVSPLKEQATRNERQIPKFTNSPSQTKRKRLSLDSDIGLTTSRTISRSTSISLEPREIIFPHTPLKKLKLAEQGSVNANDVSHQLKPLVEIKPKDQMPGVEEQLDLSITNILGKQLSETENNASVLLTYRPQGFDSVPEDIFAGHGDTSDNIETEFYPIIFKPDSSDKSKQPSQKKTFSENENSDSENTVYDLKPEGNTSKELDLDSCIPDINEFANKSPKFEEPFMNDFMSQTMTDELGKIMEESYAQKYADSMLDRNNINDIDLLSQQITNTNPHQCNHIPLLLDSDLLYRQPDTVAMKTVNPFDIVRKVPNKNADESFNSTKDPNDFFDFEREFLAYSDLITMSEVNLCEKIQPYSMSADSSLHIAPPPNYEVPTNYPAVEVLTEIGFESPDELLTVNNELFSSSDLKESRTRYRTCTENETLETVDGPIMPQVDKNPVELIANGETVFAENKPKSTENRLENYPIDNDIKKNAKDFCFSAPAADKPKWKKPKLTVTSAPAKQEKPIDSPVKLKSHARAYWRQAQVKISDTSLNTFLNSSDGKLESSPKIKEVRANLTPLPDLGEIGHNKHKLGTDDIAAIQPSHKKPRIQARSNASIDDLFDRLKQEPAVNPVMQKHITMQGSSETDDNFTKDSSIAIFPSMPIISTPSRQENSPKLSDLGNPCIDTKKPLTLDATQCKHISTPPTSTLKHVKLAENSIKSLVSDSPTKIEIDSSKVKFSAPIMSEKTRLNSDLPHLKPNSIKSLILPTPLTNPKLYKKKSDPSSSSSPAKFAFPNSDVIKPSQSSKTLIQKSAVRALVSPSLKNVSIKAPVERMTASTSFGVCPSTTSSYLPPSSSTLSKIAAKIESIKNDIKKLSEPGKTYSEHKERVKQLEEKRFQLDNFQKKFEQESSRQSKNANRTKSHSERQPFNNFTSIHQYTATSSQRETKDKSKPKYVNKFAELKNQASEVVLRSECIPSTSQEYKTLSSWDPNPISNDEIIAELKMKAPRRD